MYTYVSNCNQENMSIAPKRSLWLLSRQPEATLVLILSLNQTWVHSPNMQYSRPADTGLW